ncbi:MAG: hypothetical protein ACR2NW_04795 [Thermodesulfobacteriota bacterium]
MDDISDFVKVGQTMNQIRINLGEPQDIKLIKRHGGPIWGPEEEFWDKIPLGSNLEVWQYKIPNGHLSLYFINSDNTLSFIAFSPKGVIYESDG